MLNQALANWLLEPPGSAKEAVRAFAYCWTACILFLPAWKHPCCPCSMRAGHDRQATAI